MFYIEKNKDIIFSRNIKRTREEEFLLGVKLNTNNLFTLIFKLEVKKCIKTLECLITIKLKRNCSFKMELTIDNI